MSVGFGDYEDARMGDDVGALAGGDKEQVDGLLDDGSRGQINDRTILQKGGVERGKCLVLGSGDSA